MDITIHHQNTMIALRKEMGWPLFRPANDSIAFTSGRSLDVEVGLELGRIAAELGRDKVGADGGDRRSGVALRAVAGPLMRSMTYMINCRHPVGLLQPAIAA